MYWTEERRVLSAVDVYVYTHIFCSISVPYFDSSAVAIWQGCVRLLSIHDVYEC